MMGHITKDKQKHRRASEERGVEDVVQPSFISSVFKELIPQGELQGN